MRDMLVYYNNLDVEPFLTAVETATSFYKDRHIDMMKDGISLPGLTLRYIGVREGILLGGRKNLP